MSALLEHLSTGCTTTCRAWSLTRKDGVSFGFTDHDASFSFDGIDFKPEAGMTAKAVAASTGMSINNSEVIGAISVDAISEEEIAAGRYDAAEITSWIVNWMNIAEREVVFRGCVGEIRRHGSAFEVELRGLTEGLNQPVGRVYQSECSTVVGSTVCGVDLTLPRFRTDVVAEEVLGGRVFRFGGFPDYDEGWFGRGTLEVLSGTAQGLVAPIAGDRWEDGARVIALREAIGLTIGAGDMLRLTAGCDRSQHSCKHKFKNLLNFRGFPDLPGDDWSMVYPARQQRLDGGSRRR